MKLTIEINQDGAAFDDGHNEETARILRTLADQIEDYRSEANALLGDGEKVTIRDLNGNNCGFLQQSN
jgi:hypothetical protein